MVVVSSVLFPAVGHDREQRGLDDVNEGTLDLPPQQRTPHHEDKSRLKKSSHLPGWAWVLIAYVIGFLLMYFGVAGAMLDFVGTREWTLKPENRLHRDLVNAAIELVRPLLATWLCALIMAIPALLVFGIVNRLLAALKWIAGIVRYYRGGG
jgi:hypothetical protein